MPNLPRWFARSCWARGWAAAARLLRRALSRGGTEEVVPRLRAGVELLTAAPTLPGGRATPGQAEQVAVLDALEEQAPLVGAIPGWEEQTVVRGALAGWALLGSTTPGWEEQAAVRGALAGRAPLVSATPGWEEQAAARGALEGRAPLVSAIPGWEEQAAVPGALEQSARQAQRGRHRPTPASVRPRRDAWKSPSLLGRWSEI